MQGTYTLARSLARTHTYTRTRTHARTRAHTHANTPTSTPKPQIAEEKDKEDKGRVQEVRLRPMLEIMRHARRDMAAAEVPRLPQSIQGMHPRAPRLPQRSPSHGRRRPTLPKRPPAFGGLRALLFRILASCDHLAGLIRT